MSLLHRTSFSEPQTHRSSISQPRKLSFAPIDVFKKPGPDELSFEATSTHTDTVSQAKKVLQVATAVVYCLVAAGPVFGYAALKPVQIAEGVYSGLCKESPVDDHGRVESCYEQELRCTTARKILSQ